VSPRPDPDPTNFLGRFRVLAGLALLALATVLAACGGESGSDDPQQVIEGASLEGIQSGDVDLSLDVSTTGGKGRKLEVLASGPFVTEGEEGQPELEITVSVVGFDGEEDIDLKGTLTALTDRAYVEFKGRDYEIESGELGLLWESLEQGHNQGEEGGGPDLTACRVAAEGMEVADLGAALSNAGTVELDDTTTTKVIGDLDAAGVVDALVHLVEDPTCKAQLKAAGRLPVDELEEAKDELTTVARDGQIEVYVGDDDIVRRVVAQLTIEPEGAKAEKVEVDFEFILQEVNEEQEITAPADVEPVQEIWRDYGLNPVDLITPVAAGEGLGDLLEELTEGGLRFIGLSGGS
jgi:protein-disulfide isomerase